MANVTIKLTVNTDAILANHPANSELGTYCQLSQTGGEDLGNYMTVHFGDSTLNVSHVTENDVISWEGIPANVLSESSIDIISVEKDQTSGSVLGNAFNTSWAFGKTVLRQVLSESPADGEESYTIYFSIQSDPDSVYAFDPKIKVHIPPVFLKQNEAAAINKSL